MKMVMDQPSSSPSAHECYERDLKIHKRLINATRGLLAMTLLALPATYLADQETKAEVEPKKIDIASLLSEGMMASISQKIAITREHLVEQLRQERLPKENTLPPRWAIAGPKEEYKVNGSYSECNRGHVPDFKAYLSPENNGGRSLGKSTRILLPKENPIQDGKYDVWFHFHGHEAFWREWVDTMEETVMVSMTLNGFSGKYKRQLPDKYTWNKIKHRLNQVVAQHYGMDQVAIDQMGVSGFSAGCAGVDRVAKLDWDNVDSAACLDGIHGAYQDVYGNHLYRLEDFEVGQDLDYEHPFMNLARNAAEGEKLFVVSHSSIPYSGNPARNLYFSSTTATANHLIWWTGGEEPAKAPLDPKKPYGVYRRHNYHNFHVIGHGGSDAGAHCSIFDDVPEILRLVQKRGFK